jgi:hypothetical protein
MTKAQHMLDRWLNDSATIDSPEALAKSIDPRVRIEGFLYSDRQRFVFPDGSSAVFANGCLSLKG